MINMIYIFLKSLANILKDNSYRKKYNVFEMNGSKRHKAYKIEYCGIVFKPTRKH